MKLIAALMLLFAFGTTFAAEVTLQSCRAITDSADRLACYDVLADAAMPVVAVSPTHAPTPVSASTHAEPLETVAAATAVVPRQQTTAEFGMEQQFEIKLEAIVSRIPGEFRGWEPKSRIILENGQVWQISDGSRATYLLNAPVVSIERGAFGTFLMHVEGANRTPKVKRVK